MIQPDRPEFRPSVLHIGKFYAPHRGGIETYLETLCGHLQPDLRQKVIVASDVRATIREEVAGVPVARMATWTRIASTPLCPGMIGEIRRSPADIVHLHLPNPPAIAAYFASRHRSRLVIGYHSDVVRQQALGRLCEPLVRRALTRASAIVAASPDYIETSALLREYRSACHVIPFGIVLREFAAPDAAAVSAVRERHGARLIVAVGRLVYYKGFEYLIDAMRGVEARLLIIGEGPLRPSLEERIRDSGVGGKVSILAGVAALAPYLHAAEVFVLPSIARSEAFGIVQVEAMACGKPVVNTSLPSGVPFVSRDGETGLTVPPRDSGALAAAIRLLLDHAEMRRRFGAAARRRAEQEFSADRMAERTLALYRSVLSAPVGPYGCVEEYAAARSAN